MKKVLWWATGVCLCLCLSSAAQGNVVVTVAPGYDLFRADPLDTVFGSASSFAPFKGVPLGSFDFGGTVGVQNTGTTDTIIKRTAPGSPGALPGTVGVPIQMVALQLQSVQPFNFNGNGVDNYFVTLQSVHGRQ